MDHQSQDIHAHKTGEPHLVGEGEDEHPHEKKTVMQRVKARARRIRSSIRKHVHDDHDQAHDGDQARDVPHDDDDDDDDDEEYDEEVEEDQETHGAPIHESVPLKSSTASTATPVNSPMTSLSDHHVASRTIETGDGKTSVPGTEVNTPLFASSLDHGPSRLSETTGHGKSSSLSHDHGTGHSKTSVPGTESTKVHFETPLTSFSDDHHHGTSKTNEIDHSKAFVPRTEASSVYLEGPGVDTPLSSFSHENIHKSSYVPETDQSRVNLEKPVGSDHFSSLSPGLSDIKESDSDNTRTIVPGTESKINLEKPVGNALLSSLYPGLSDDVKESNPTKTIVPESESESKVNLERTKELEKDPQAPEDLSHKHTPSNYQTKVTDPTGKGAKEIEGTPILSSFDKMNIHDESESKPKQHLPTESHDQFSSEHSSLNPISTTQHLETSQKSSAPISEKIPAVASALADSAVSAKEVVASKVGHGEKNNTETHETTGNYTPQHPKTVEESLGTQKPESNPEHITSPKPASPTSYAQKFSYATSAIYGTAVSAKNAVASTFGYGEKNNTGLHETTGDYDTTSNEPASETETEHRKKMASTETDQHSPLYEKETGEGSEAMSKMHGPENSARELEKSSSETKEQDKGVSIKGYLAEKLVPGDEDRALSEVITDTFNKRKEEPESVPVGKVTVSDHVAKTLGTADEENESNYAIKTRGTVASWFGLSGDGQSPASQDSTANTKGEKDDKTQERE
uniref:Low-temperature-induced 65 kDa protein n=1 Tax=Cannabis sativa TaxID=3483 RepID=A0A803PQR3_CANSA